MGTSKDGGIPLTYPLTDRVRGLLDASSKAVVDTLVGELPATVHIEHILSHLGDYTALATRSKDGAVTLGGRRMTVKELEAVHTEAVKHIATTVRWGFVSATDTEAEKVGTYSAPIVSVAGHSAFVQALFRTAQAGLHERRAGSVVHHELRHPS